MSRFARMIFVAKRKLKLAIMKREEKEKELKDIQDKYDEALMEWVKVCMEVGEEKLCHQENEANTDYLAGVQSEVLKSLIKKLRED